MQLARPPCRQSGFTYLGVLFAVALIGIGLTAASEVWVTTVQRQKMTQLDWIGGQFVAGIASYHAASPGSVKSYPSTFEDLLQDGRYLFVKRHLRTVYLNPFTGKADWEPIVTEDGRIRGVRAIAIQHGSPTLRDYIYQPDVVPSTR